MEVVIKGEAKEIVALVLAVQERQEVIKSPNDARENMIKALAEVCMDIIGEEWNVYNKKIQKIENEHKEIAYLKQTT